MFCGTIKMIFANLIEYLPEIRVIFHDVAKWTLIHFAQGEKMAIKVPKAFFDAKDVLYIGYSERSIGYSEMVRKALEEAGKTVYPVNPKGTWGDVTVYKTIESIPAKPWFALVLTDKKNTKNVVESLIKNNIKRVLFGSSQSVDQDILDQCKAHKIQTAIACPLMAYGKGMHRFHGWLAGVEKSV
jgi:predicted CoA-binding protein